MSSSLGSQQPVRRRPVLLGGLAAAAVAAAGAALWWRGGRAPAPDTPFLLLNGSQMPAASLRGQVALVNFWATSCTTCVAEMPEIVATYEKYRARGFATVAVAMQYDRPDYVARFAGTRALPFTVALDSTGDVARAWGDVQLTPTTFLVSKQGEIVARFVGKPDFEALHRQIEGLLAEA